LVVGDDDEPGGGAGAGRVEHVPVRGVDLVESTEAPAHTRAGLRITHHP
jgi:hypothetical protein